MSSALIDPYRQTPAFSPASLPNVIAWWDAADAASFSYSSGAVVSAWASRVGSYALTNATAGNRPSRSATVNGLAAVSFATSKSLSVGSFDMTGGGQKFTLWAVFAAAASGDCVVMEHTANFNGTPGAWILYREATGTYMQLSKRGNSVYSTALSAPVTVTTTPKMVIGTHDGKGASVDETTLRVNGNATSAPPADTDDNNLSATLYVGGRGGSSLYLHGTICELGVSTGVLTAPEIASLETYLSTKWGL